MGERTEIVLAGLAGQGLVFAGTVLADAVGLYQGKFISQLAFYSVSTRTGPSRSEVVIGDEEIDFPAVTQPDIVLAFTGADAQSYSGRMRPGGMLIVDSDQDCSSLPESLLVYRVPLVSIAQRELGETLLANLVALGALAALSGVVTLESLERAVTARVSGARGERSVEALRRGHSAGLLLKKT